MNWALTARVIIWTILAFFAVGIVEFLAWVAYVEIKKLVIARRTRNQLQERTFPGLLNSEARRVRLAKLVVLADQYEAAETDKERAKLYRKASALGFTDSGNETDYCAFMDSDEGPRAA